MKNLIAAGRKVCTTELSFSLLFSLLFVLGSLLVDARRFPKPDISVREEKHHTLLMCHSVTFLFSLWCQYDCNKIQWDLTYN